MCTEQAATEPIGIPVHVPTWLEIMQPSIRAVRANMAPFLLIQAFGIALVVTYYHSPEVRSAMSVVSDMKARGGEGFVLACGAMSGGVLPQVARIVTGQTRTFDRAFWWEMLSNSIIFALVGAEVELFYRGQTALFGPGIDAPNLIKKTMLDMFFMTPVIFGPTGLLMLRVKESGLDALRLKNAFSVEFYRKWVLPTLPLNWAYWIPILLCVYAMPTGLQFPVAQIAEGCWSLFYVFMAKEFSSS